MTSSVPFWITLGYLGVAILLGLRARAGHSMNSLEEWGVAGRSPVADPMPNGWPWIKRANLHAALPPMSRWNPVRTMDERRPAPMR